MLMGTVKAVIEASVCNDRYRAIRKAQKIHGIEWADDKPGPLVWILNLGTVDDFLWVLRVADPPASSSLLVDIGAAFVDPFLDDISIANPGVVGIHDLVRASRMYAAGGIVNDAEGSIRRMTAAILSRRAEVRTFLSSFDAACLVAMLSIGGTPAETSEILRDIARLSKHSANEACSRKGISGVSDPMEALVQVMKNVGSALMDEEKRQVRIIKHFVADVDLPIGGN